MRYLIITNVLKNSFRFSCPKFGYRISIISFLLSTILSVLFFFQYQFVEISKWAPGLDCGLESIYLESRNYPEFSVYGRLCNEFSAIHDGLFHRIQAVIEGIFGKFIPCVLLPVLTMMLIMKLRSSDQNAAR